MERLCRWSTYSASPCHQTRGRSFLIIGIIMIISIFIIILPYHLAMNTSPINDNHGHMIIIILSSWSWSLAGGHLLLHHCPLHASGLFRHLFCPTSQCESMVMKLTIVSLVMMVKVVMIVMMVMIDRKSRWSTFFSSFDFNVSAKVMSRCGQIQWKHGCDDYHKYFVRTLLMSAER